MEEREFLTLDVFILVVAHWAGVEDDAQYNEASLLGNEPNTSGFDADMPSSNQLSDRDSDMDDDIHPGECGHSHSI